ncbi:ATP-binding protein [Streptomyces sp. NPDC057877]|uniref:ATP-binding protein n=1 Tax=Streptomyces sp. NPDC057877 TaxID=3346269 RepID=UPI003693FEBA
MPGYEISEPRLRCVLPFEAAPAEVRLLRRAASEQLTRWGLLAATDEIELLVTELATNVVKHVGEGVAATLVLERRGERLRVEVHDRSRTMPSPRTAACEGECGRGLHLLASLARDWGAVLTAAGKEVWCEIPVKTGQPCQRVERAATTLESYRGVAGADAAERALPAAVLEESAVELIADLLHWTAARGRDPEGVLGRAQARFEAETGAEAA